MQFESDENMSGPQYRPIPKSLGSGSDLAIVRASFSTSSEQRFTQLSSQRLKRGSRAVGDQQVAHPETTQQAGQGRQPERALAVRGAAGDDRPNPSGHAAYFTSHADRWMSTRSGLGCVDIWPLRGFDGTKRQSRRRATGQPKANSEIAMKKPMINPRAEPWKAPLRGWRACGANVKGGGANSGAVSG
jgi:hypothetical protein